MISNELEQQRYHLTDKMLESARIIGARFELTQRIGLPHKMARPIAAVKPAEKLIVLLSLSNKTPFFLAKSEEASEAF